MVASNLTVNGFGSAMNGLEFFFPASATVATPAAVNPTTSAAASAENNGEDVDWGDFVYSSDSIAGMESLPTDSIGFFADHNGTDTSERARPDSEGAEIESEKKNQAQWVKPRGPVPLSVFGEVEGEGSEGDGLGAMVPSLTFSFDSFSSKHNNSYGSVNKAVNTHPSVGINDLIANLYRENGENKSKNGFNMEPENSLGNLDMKGKNSHWNSQGLDANLSNLGTAGFHVNVGSSNLEQNGTDSSHNVPNPVVGLEHLTWNPLNLGVESFEPKSSRMNSSTSAVMLDPNGSSLSFVDQNDEIDEDDGWEFKAAESTLQTGDGDSKRDEKAAVNGPVPVSNTSNLSWSFWSPATVRIGPEVNNVKTDTDNPVSDLGNGDDDSWIDDGWEYKVAEPEELRNVLTSKVEGKGSEDVKGAGFAFENGVHHNDDLFAPSFRQSIGWGFGFDFNPTSKIEALFVSHSNSQREQHGQPNDLSFFQSVENMNLEETSWAFKQASSETGTKNEEDAVVTDIPPTATQTPASDSVIQKKEPQFEKPKGPLSLSIFGDGGLEDSDPVIHEDISTSIQASSLIDKTKARGPSISISDLISSLYSQAEEKTSVDLTKNSDENGFGSAKTVADSKPLDGEGDLEDYSWEFQGPTQGTMDSGVAEVDNFDDDSWEFQVPTQPVTNSNSMKVDSSSWELTGNSVGNESESQSSIPAGIGERHEKAATKIELNDYKDFYDKLKTELCYIVINHLEDLKKARGLAADSGEGAAVEKYDEEIRDLNKRLHEDTLICGVNLECIGSKHTCTSEFIQALQEPKFQALEAEYHLSERLLAAEKDGKSTIELLKHTILTLKILTLGSPDWWSNYTSAWSDIASACAQELRHGESIWKQAFEKNVHEEILSKSQGKNYILALGEVYRVAKILRASATLYKPWILVSPKSTLPALLDNCDSIWSRSGLEEALRNISNSSELHLDKSAATLLESIKYISELDAFTLHSHVCSAREPTCCISGLTAKIIPGIKMVEWNGETYFLTLANLWANLINADPPRLPRILLG